MTRKFRTAARLTSKPLSAFELECAGFDAGRADAVSGRTARHTGYYPEHDHYAEGYCRGWRYVVAA